MPIDLCLEMTLEMVKVDSITCYRGVRYHDKNPLLLLEVGLRLPW